MRKCKNTGNLYSMLKLFMGNFSKENSRRASFSTFFRRSKLQYLRSISARKSIDLKKVKTEKWSWARTGRIWFFILTLINRSAYAKKRSKSISNHSNTLTCFLIQEPICLKCRNLSATIVIKEMLVSRRTSKGVSLFSTSISLIITYAWLILRRKKMLLDLRQKMKSWHFSEKFPNRC